MTITDDMIDALRARLTANSYADDEECRAALTAALAAQPAEYPECSGDPRSCPENEGFGCCQTNPQPQPAGEVTVTRREDGSIAAVTRTDAEGRVLSVIAECQRKPQPARVPLTLPPLPEPNGHTWGHDAQMRMTKTPNGHYTAGDLHAYARACAAAWGVTLADEGGAK